MRRRTIASIRNGAVVAITVAILILVVQGVRVATAGGLGSTTVRPTCAYASGGGFTRQYRIDEGVRLDRRYLPPSAVCRWSGGTSVALVSSLVGWAGLALAALGVGTLVAAGFVRPVR